VHSEESSEHLKFYLKKNTFRCTKYVLVVTARNVAERGIAKASCPSVRPSVCNVEVSWSYRLEFCKKIISRLITLSFSLSAEPQHDGSTPRGTPQILAGIGVGYGKLSFSTFKPPYL